MMSSSVSPAGIRKFAHSLKGDVILPGDPRYEKARRVWNHAVDLHPAIIARCAGTEDSFRWVQDFFAALQPHSSGAVYVSDLENEGEDRARAAYGDNYARLATIKHKYHPRIPSASTRTSNPRHRGRLSPPPNRGVV